MVGVCAVQYEKYGTCENSAITIHEIVILLVAINDCKGQQTTPTTLALKCTRHIATLSYNMHNYDI